MKKMEIPYWMKIPYCQQKCCICENYDPVWPIIDYSTCFLFCADCFQEARNLYIERCVDKVVDVFAEWLEIIAEVRKSKLEKAE